MNTNRYFIVLDFDGTVVKHHYPNVGPDIGAVPVLKRIIANGHKIILNTMRSHDSGGVDTLQPAIDWFALNKIPLFGINENPTQHTWTSSPKVYGELYIDDAALGAPLKKYKGDIHSFIDWEMASIHLYYKGVLTKDDLISLVKEGLINNNLVQIEI